MFSKPPPIDGQERVTEDSQRVRFSNFTPRLCSTLNKANPSGGHPFLRKLLEVPPAAGT